MVPDEDALDELIEQITVDAYGDEGYWSFLQTITDEVAFPFPASLLGMEVVVTDVDFDGDERRGLLASVERPGSSAAISLLELDFSYSDRNVALLVAAYRRWVGTS